MKPVKPMTIDRWIDAAAARTPEKPAIVFEGRGMTYVELASRIEDRARGLAASGIDRGDRVAWYGLNHPEVFILLFACARLGAILVPINWRLAQAEVAEIVADCTPRLMMHDRHFREQALSLPDIRVVGVDAGIPAGSRVGRQEVSEDDTLLLVFTSGSTGRPKGVMLTQGALSCNAEMSVEAHRLRPDARVLNVLPLFHVGGLNILPTPAFSVGATVLLHERFNPDAACAALQRATHAITVPTVLQAIIDSEGWNHADLSSLLSISIGSTNVPASLIEAVQVRGVPVTQIYGATETGPLAIYQRVDEALATTGSIGQAGSNCEIRIVRDGQDAEDGEPGEICVRGRNVMTGYWHNSALTASAMQDGWFRTGDVAKRDANGNYWFVDRIKHVIISGGENIYPAEIESILRDVPGIVEVAVVGRHDPKWGETPVAVVVAERAMSTDEVLDPLHDRIARFKQPKAVVFVDALPRNAMGKVATAELRVLVNRSPVETGIMTSGPRHMPLMSGESRH